MGSFIGISILLMILNEVFEYFNDPPMYLSTFLNFGWWALILSMVFTVLPAFGLQPRPWQYPVAAVSLKFMQFHVRTFLTSPDFGPVSLSVEPLFRLVNELSPNRAYPVLWSLHRNAGKGKEFV